MTKKTRICGRTSICPVVQDFLLIVTLLLLSFTAYAQRIALVVGNSSYADRPLRNPVHDAKLMEKTLLQLGFRVQTAIDVDRREFLSALRDFESQSRGAEVSLFFFAGHGAQFGGNNYLIPVKSNIRSDGDLSDESLDVIGVIRRIEESRAQIGIVILDACRDNPYPGSNRTSLRGLARMSVPTGTIVAYSTAPGSTAEDGTGVNSPYTDALVRNLLSPGMEIREVFDRTAQEVERVTGGRQRPREEIGLRVKFTLNEAPVALGDDLDRELWELSKRRDSIPGYEGYLLLYPQGRFAVTARATLSVLKNVEAAPPQEKIQSSLPVTSTYVPRFTNIEERLVKVEEQLQQRKMDIAGGMVSLDDNDSSIEDLIARLVRIEIRIAGVEGKLSAVSDRVAAAVERVAAIDFRVGSVETNSNDFDDRLRVLEPLTVRLDGQEFQALQEEKRLYEEAVTLLRTNAFDKAIQTFDLLLRRHPGSGFIHAARYGLASAHFGSRSHKDAVEFFRQFVSDAPEHPRAPDALLAMSSSQLELKDRVGARRTIEGLIKSYPNSEAALVGRQRLPSLK